MDDRCEFEIGIATVDITPPLGVKLAGYGARGDRGETAIGVGHRLRAEAMVCKGDRGAWAMITSDTVGYPRDFVLRVREKIAAGCGLSAESVLVSATHTHSGPAAMRTYSSDATDLEKRYCRELEERLARVTVEAHKAASPGCFEVAWTEAPDLGSNRRVRRPDGTWENDWQDPDGKHTGYFDPAVLLVGVRRPDGRRDALLVNYGCHPVVLGPRSLRISADYPGYMKDYLEARGLAGTAMFALAGGGNINPRTCIMVGAEHPRRMGEELGRIVAEAACKLHPAAGGPVRAASAAWKLISKRKWPEGSGREQGKQIESELQALRAGDLCVLGLPGELFSEYAALLREASPLPHTAVVSIANDSLGYLPTDDAVPQGGHEVNAAAAERVQQDLLDRAGEAFAAIADAQ
ncbi:MAG TPA: neutral/alkaline non-lysosomal ceramidase N-terminal domain-containing protein [Phycisphaerae bacterium]|nr:neutral/alkaline non-lysosomal ceramidase N-terminal domain-containing protein [Phycisphaerae bacterium]